jgi:prepilin-type N-terminal cleavage/methylation domain-containing protein
MQSLHDESGFTLIELLITCAVLVTLMGGLATIFGIGLSTSKTSNSILASQSGVVVALDQLDYQARCASSAALVSGGVGVRLTFPSQCTHQGGATVTQVTWCVTGGSLVRYSNSSSCSGSSQTWTKNVTSTTPFSCVTSGSLPQVKVQLTVNTGTTWRTASSGTDSITLENATSGSACS